MVEKERKYVDVNVFVYWLVSSKYTERAKLWIRKIEQSVYGEFCTSTITPYEVAVIVAGLIGESLSNKDFIEKIISAFKSLKQLAFIPLEKKDILEVARIMEETGLDMEDSIHYIVARKSRAKMIISNDKDFDKTDLKRVF